MSDRLSNSEFFGLEDICVINFSCFLQSKIFVELIMLGTKLKARQKSISSIKRDESDDIINNLFCLLCPLNARSI